MDSFETIFEEKQWSWLIQCEDTFAMIAYYSILFESHLVLRIFLILIYVIFVCVTIYIVKQ